MSLAFQQRRCATLVLVVVGMLSACSANQGAREQCVDDTQCGGDVCMMGKCLPRGTARTVAIEISPRTDSAATRTGIASMGLGPDPITLIADDRVVVDGTVTDAPDAHVVLSAAGPIPGQGDLQFETELAKFKFEIGIGRSLLSKMGMVWLLPSAKTQEQPPVPFGTTLDATLNLTFPRSAEMAMVRAALHNSLDAPLNTHVARAYVGTKVVSNAVMTDSTGLFQLLIAPGAVPPEAAGMITVEFSPADPMAEDVRFVTTPFAVASVAASAKPRIFRMPAFGVAAPLRFKVQKGATIADAGSDVAGAPIPDITVRFRTEIPATQDNVVVGTAIYEREQRSDIEGEVEVSLLPGTATDPRMYEITILPPPDSPFAGRCVAQHPVTIVGNGRYSATFSLDPKVTLKGIIVGSDASPAAGASVTATFIRGTTVCINPTTTSPVSNTADRSGRYEMQVDPGTYRLEIDPPAGAPLPRLTEDGADALSVMGNLTHDVFLPSGEVVVGDVRGADGLPVGAAGIKIFQVLCAGDTCEGSARVAPLLRSQTRTDADGRFRAVLPLSP